MSVESAKAFIEKMKTDEDFRNKVNECKDNENRKAFIMLPLSNLAINGYLTPQMSGNSF